MEQIQAIINEANLAGMTELERMDAQHAAKMEKLAQLAEGEAQFKQELRDAELILEQEHQTKRLDMILGTGSKIQKNDKRISKRGNYKVQSHSLPLILVDCHSIAAKCF